MRDTEKLLVAQFIEAIFDLSDTTIERRQELVVEAEAWIKKNADAWSTVEKMVTQLAPTKTSN
jgi:hypothetical protein